MKVFITDLKKIINRQAFISAHLSDIMPADYQRSQNIKDENRLLQFLAGRILILENFGTDFETQSNGKIISNKGYLSLAHSNNFVVLATDDEPIGVDIERIDNKRNFQKIALRMKFGKCNTVEDFYKKWTAYEADFKLNPNNKKTSHRFFVHDGFMICISSLRKKEINIKLQNLL